MYIFIMENQIVPGTQIKNNSYFLGYVTCTQSSVIELQRVKLKLW